MQTQRGTPYDPMTGSSGILTEINTDGNELSHDKCNKLNAFVVNSVISISIDFCPVLFIYLFTQI